MAKKLLKGILPNDVSDARRKAEGLCSILSDKKEREGCLKGTAAVVNQLEQMRPGLAGRKSRTLSGVWVGFKKFYGPHAGRVEWQNEYFDQFDASFIESAREKVREEYARVFPDNPDCTPLGFVPSHITDRVIEGLGIKSRSGLDKIMLSIAVSQTIKITDGTWESGPVGKWKPLKSPLPRSICGF